MADISDLLEDVGLDPDYWKCVLKNQLGIVNKASIKHLDSNYALQEILSAKCIRHNWEASALKELFNKSKVSNENQNEMNLMAAELLSQEIEKVSDINSQHAVRLAISERQPSATPDNLNPTAETREDVNTDATMTVENIPQTIVSAKDTLSTSLAIFDPMESVDQLSSSVVGSVVPDEHEQLQNVSSQQKNVCARILSNLILIKLRRISSTGTEKLSIALCLSNKNIHTILTNIVQSCKNNSNAAEIWRIRTLMKMLLADDADYVDKDFYKDIWAWINQKENEENFSMDMSKLSRISLLLKQLIDDFMKRRSDDANDRASVDEIKKMVTLEISQRISQMTENLHGQGLSEELLIVSSVVCAWGFDEQSKKFTHSLSDTDIDFIINKIRSLHEGFLKMSHQSKLQAQADLLLQTLLLADEQVARWRARVQSCMEGKLELDLAEAIVTEDVPDLKQKLETYVEAQINVLDQMRKEDVYSDGKSAGNEGSELCCVCRALETRPIVSEEGTKNSHFHEDSTRKDFNRQRCIDVSREPPEGHLCIQHLVSVGKRCAVHELLERLNLTEYYPKKIHMNDVLMIDELSVDSGGHLSGERLWILFVQKLMMLDYNARYLTAKKDVAETAKHEEYAPKETERNEGDDDLFDTLMSKGSQSKRNVKNDSIHPMDLQMAVFHCSDNFVRPYLFGKLATCQYAVPLIVPNPCSDEIVFNLWACRSIKIFRFSPGKHDKQEKLKLSSVPVEGVKLPIVSFMRLGSLTTSKSQTLNLILNKGKHHTFFNRQCQGYSAACHLMNGVVEMAWYVASGRKEDTFDDSIAFTNLHGDATQYPQQVDFLQAVSSVNVIVMAVEERQRYKQFINNFMKTRQPLIFLFSDKDVMSTSPDDGNVMTIAAKDRNGYDLLNEIKTAIKQLLKRNDSRMSLEEMGGLSLAHGMTLDENEGLCQDAKLQADLAMKSLRSGNRSDLKSNFLPLQGQLWQRWCELDKSLNNLKDTENESLEARKFTIRMGKENVRNEQKNKASPLNEFMKNCIDGMSNSSNEFKTYFVHWLQGSLDALFCEDYKEGYSFGIEHVLREIGQIYEAGQDPERLAEVATDLFTQGYPFELMDGDVAYVPLEWVTAILEKTSMRLQNAKVFVLSVLGLQSSGKSTLLNAMFGVQFAVSAGRCTRGAYMQLLRVSDNLRQTLDFNYVLIVDTEGLRSIELSNTTVTSHDNKLAAFVIGLANTTVINIYGENPSEIQDILQISVQAFLRMRRVNLHPSCVFVYQNVEDVTAYDKTVLARNNLKKLLNEMTAVAAKEEGSHVRNFSEVIRFDIDKDTRYFSHLWDSNPPMAPPNPYYSQNVQELKSYLFSGGEPYRCKNAPTMTEFKCRVTDLWNALLNENFVFNFKNSIEIAEYNMVEKEFQNWSWELRQCAIETEESNKNRIANKNVSESEIIKDILEKMQGKFLELFPKLEQYFNDENKQTVRVKWRGSTENKLKDLKKELIRKTSDNCVADLKKKRSREQLDSNNELYEQQLMESSKSLAAKLKNQAADEATIEKEFEKLWQNMIDTISVEIYEKRDIFCEIQNILLKSFEKERSVLEFLQQYKGIFIVDTDKHVSRPWYGVAWSKEKHKAEIERQVNWIQSKISNYISGKEVRNAEYNPQYIYEIITRVRSDIVKLNKDYKKRHNFTLTDLFTFELTAHVCLDLAGRFTQMRDKYLYMSSPITHLNTKRDKYYTMFNMCCKDATEIQVFVGLLIGGMENGIRTASLRKTCTDVANKIRGDNPALNENRIKLEYAILRHLAVEKEFESFMEYIIHPVEYMTGFITKQVEDLCKTRSSDVESMFERRVEELHGKIGDAVEHACKETVKEKGNLNYWLQQFQGQLNETVVMDKQSVNSFENLAGRHLSHLKETIRNELDNAVEKIKTDMKNVLIDRLIADTYEFHPAQILLEAFKGCEKQCPFCGTLCTSTLPTHDEHSAPYHRPEAVKGWYYNETNIFTIDICTTLVCSNVSFNTSKGWIPYKTYRDAGGKYAEWSIKADNSILVYWQWFVSEFEKDLQNRYGHQFKDKGKIPPSWKKHTQQDAVAEIDKFIRPK